MHMPVNENFCVSIAAPSSFACGEMAYRQKLQVMHKVRTCTGMWLLSWHSCVHSGCIDVLSGCVPKCPDRPYGMQATHMNTCMACCTDLRSMCCFVLLPAALSSAGSARMRSCGEGESKSQS